MDCCNYVEAYTGGGHFYQQQHYFCYDNANTEYAGYEPPPISSAIETSARYNGAIPPAYPTGRYRKCRGNCSNRCSIHKFMILFQVYEIMIQSKLCNISRRMKRDLTRVRLGTSFLNSRIISLISNGFIYYFMKIQISYSVMDLYFLSNSSNKIEHYLNRSPVPQITCTTRKRRGCGRRCANRVASCPDDRSCRARSPELA